MPRPGGLRLAAAHTTRGLQQRTAKRRADQCFRPSLFIGSACKASTSAMSGQDELQGHARELIPRGCEGFPDRGRIRSPSPLSTAIVRLADSSPSSCHLCRRLARGRVASGRHERDSLARAPAPGCLVRAGSRLWTTGTSHGPALRASACPFSVRRVALERRVGRSRSTRFTGGPAGRSAVRQSIASIGVLRKYRLAIRVGIVWRTAHRCAEGSSGSADSLGRDARVRAARERKRHERRDGSHTV
jgi:hypothetical protein